MSQDPTAVLLLAEARRRLLEDSLPRIRKCLAQLSDEDVWSRPNENTPSVGNLLLHLAGNVRQWIVSGLGGAPDVREREKEFLERGPIDRDELLRRVEATLREADGVLERVDPGRLGEERTVQGFRETGVGILVHVVEHFSYHVGQITYVTKAKKNVDLDYYAGKDLNLTAEPQDDP